MDGTLDGQVWDNSTTVEAVTFSRGSFIPWESFSAEFSPGGLVDETSAEEKDLRLGMISMKVLSVSIETSVAWNEIFLAQQQPRYGYRPSQGSKAILRLWTIDATINATNFRLW